MINTPHEYILWIALGAYALHMLEEFELNWKAWATQILRLPVEWSSFYVVNAIVVVLGVCCAMVGWKSPAFALAFPALMLINATLFHVLPTVVTRVFSPGLASAVVLFYPVAGWVVWGAWSDRVLSLESVLGALAIGAGLMASPIILLKVKGLKAFQYGQAELTQSNNGPMQLESPTHTARQGNA